MTDDTRPSSRLHDIGGTPGGLGEFLLGLAFTAAGGYMLLTRAHVSGGFWGRFGLGDDSFGYALVVLAVGVGFLFYDGRSAIGWLLTGAAAVFVVVGILMSLRLWFEATSVFGVVVMVVLLFGGIGLIARSLRSHPAGSPR